MVNYKIPFSYIFSSYSYKFINYNTQGRRNISILTSNTSTYYAILHLKLSTTFYTSQLVDIFSYEAPVYNTSTSTPKTPSQWNFSKAWASKLNTGSLIIVYNFHNITDNTKILFFTLKPKLAFNWNLRNQTKPNQNLTTSLKSITELYPNANWLEREVAELFDVIFEGKKDTRNLMLQYGDMSSPFQKSFPSSGFKEMTYDAVADLITQTDTECQV